MSDFLFLKIRCLRSRKAYCSYNSKKTTDKKSRMKKFISFQHFGNILTDSESPAFKFVRIGLTYRIVASTNTCYYPENQIF